MPSNKKLLQAAAGNAGGDNLYVEDVFSTYLYEGNDTARSINNGVDLTEGGLVWAKNRTSAYDHQLFDTETGVGKYLISNGTSDAGVNAQSLTSFNSNGFSLGTAWTNAASQNYASWTFRKAEKFFDVVTYSSDTTSGARTISHNLGSTPAFILVKGLNFSDSWYVYHIGTGVNKYLELNSSGTGHASTNFWGVTDSTFTVDGFLNNNGSTGKDYVAYLFASDAGGFGDDGDENIIKCGSFADNGSGTFSVELGFEPQFVIMKASNASDNWYMLDSMRNMTNSGSAFYNDSHLVANSSVAEATVADIIDPTPTGFISKGALGAVNIIYIAIRRPMKTPEAGTEVFAPISLGTTTEPGFISNFVTDFTIHRTVDETAGNQVSSRMTGNEYMLANTTSAVGTISAVQWDFMNGSRVGNGTANADEIQWMFKRATGFMDVVAYTGNSTAGRAVAHNLGVAPEMIWVRGRVNSYGWIVGASSLGATKSLELDTTAAMVDYGSAYWNSTLPTNSAFVLGTDGETNYVNYNYIAYLFATLAGVSKVGSYTGNATNTTIDCGFSNGARFVLIKRTDATGDWFVYDSNRGITTGVSPYITLNTTATEVTNAGWLEAASSGFLVNDNASTQLNINNATYIFLAIA